jgi:hypothetical protein
MNKRLYTLPGIFVAAACGTTCMPLQAAPSQQSQANQVPGDKFYCNIKALTPAERISHKQMTDRLIAARTETVETPNGYEFQFSPSNITIAELADWVAAEGKCCPFFDFHIDLEKEGKLLCLRLTGTDGIKPFIREEFHVSLAK